MAAVAFPRFQRAARAGNSEICAGVRRPVKFSSLLAFCRRKPTGWRAAKWALVSWARLAGFFLRKGFAGRRGGFSRWLGVAATCRGFRGRERFCLRRDRGGKSLVFAARARCGRGVCRACANRPGAAAAFSSLAWVAAWVVLIGETPMLPFAGLARARRSGLQNPPRFLRVGRDTRF